MGLTYEYHMEQEKENYKKRVAWIEKYKNLFPIAVEYGKMFGELVYFSPERYADIYFCPMLNIHLNLHPSKEDTIKVAYPTVDAMIKDPRLEMVSPLQRQPYNDQEYVYAIFQERASKEERKPYLSVYIYIDRVNTCKKVGTGKFKEIMKVVCSDEAS